MFPRFSTLIGFISLLFFISVNSSSANASVMSEMQKRHKDFVQSQEAGALPFTLDSSSKRGVISASVRAFLPDISFSLFSKQLSQVGQWCEFVTLHLNIKSCSFRTDLIPQKLGFYVGVKGYLTPDQASLLLMNFESETVEDVLRINFSAKDGPYDSSNYDFRVRAIGVTNASGKEGVYLEFDFSSVPGYVSSLANVYFLTVARKKVGFSIAGKTWSGAPKYVRGQRGAAERNVVRYLLAIKVYFETLDILEGQRYEESLQRWFDATQEYKKQLYEMDRETYLSIKDRERQNQFILMEARASNTKPIYHPEIQKLR